MAWKMEWLGKTYMVGLAELFFHEAGCTLTLPGWIRSYDSAGFFSRASEVWLCCLDLGSSWRASRRMMTIRLMKTLRLRALDSFDREF